MRKSIIVIISALLFLGKLLFSDQTSTSAIKIKAVGDMVPGTNFPSADSLPQNFSDLFSKVDSLLKDQDLLFANLETTLTHYPKTRKNTNRARTFAFRTPPEYASQIKSAGFQVLSIANNHSFDFFEQGFKDTASNLSQVGIVHTGIKNEISYITIKNIKFSFIGFSTSNSHNSINEIQAAKKLVKKAKASSQICVVSFHGGKEGSDAINTRNATENFYGENRGNVVFFSHEMILSGADIVIGHGPHVPRAFELFNNKFIAYSLGNFMGYKVFSTKGYNGISLVLEIEVDNQGNFLKGKILPIKLDQSGIPYPDSTNSSIALIKKLSTEDFPESRLMITNSGEIIKN